LRATRLGVGGCAATKFQQCGALRKQGSWHTDASCFKFKWPGSGIETKTGVKRLVLPASTSRKDISKELFAGSAVWSSGAWAEGEPSPSIRPAMWRIGKSVGEKKAARAPGLLHAKCNAGHAPQQRQIVCNDCMFIQLALNRQRKGGTEITLSYRFMQVCDLQLERNNWFKEHAARAARVRKRCRGDWPLPTDLRCLHPFRLERVVGTSHLPVDINVCALYGGRAPNNSCTSPVPPFKIRTSVTDTKRAHILRARSVAGPRLWPRRARRTILESQRDPLRASRPRERDESFL
jgi:hypothetical protein